MTLAASRRLTERLAGYPIVRKLELVQDGVTVRQLESVVDALGVTLQRLAPVLPLSEASLSRRRRDGRPLDLHTSEVILRLAELLSLASEAFGDREAGRQWLIKENPALSHSAPIDWLSTEVGSREVRRLLANIEYGGVL